LWYTPWRKGTDERQAIGYRIVNRLLYHVGLVSSAPLNESEPLKGNKVLVPIERLLDSAPILEHTNG
jgi:hypothetical protein